VPETSYQSPARKSPAPEYHAFEAVARWPGLFADDCPTYCEVEKDHGRIQTRRYVVQDVSSRGPSSLDERWAGLNTRVRVASTRENRRA
jgi:hypothetical protein